MPLGNAYCHAGFGSSCSVHGSRHYCNASPGHGGPHICACGEVKAK